MAQILTVENGNVSVGSDDGSIVTVPQSAVNYENPKVGDKVKIFKDGDKVIVAWDGAVQSAAQDGYPAGATTINKHLFVWVGAFLAGGFGVDRFMRGQIGLGVVKLLFGWVTLGIWSLVDFIIALTKAYGGAFGKQDDIVFVNGKYAK